MNGLHILVDRLLKPTWLTDNRRTVDRRNIRWAAATSLLAATFALAGDKGFTPPPTEPAVRYPAHETHSDENVTIAIDPYDTPAKYAIFKVKYREIGFLPVRLIITNDGPAPLMLNDLKIEYITVQHDKIEPATTEDIYRRITHPEKAGTHTPLPFPVPRKQGRGIKKDDVEEIQSASFVPFPVTPRSTYSGFLFFDIRGVDSPEAGAHIYLTGIKSGTKELFYFDIPMDKYLAAGK